MALVVSKVKEGTILESNDKRFPGRRITITRIVTEKGKEFAQYKTTSRIERINLKSIYDVGSKGARGWRVAANQRAIKGG